MLVQSYHRSEGQGVRLSSRCCLEANRDKEQNENQIGIIIYEEQKEDVFLNPLSPVSFSLYAVLLLAFSVSNQAF